MARCHLRHICFLAATVVLLTLSGQTLAIDIGIKTPVCRFYVSYDGDITCRVGAEFAIPHLPGAQLEIGHEFKIAPEYSYLVFRNRRTGKDNVFKIPQSSRVELMATENIVIGKGQKIITVAPDPNRKKCFIIELGDALQEKVDIKLHVDDGAELFRLDLGLLRPYLIIDSEGNIRTKQVTGDTKWFVDALDFVAIVRSSNSQNNFDLLIVHKPGIDRSPESIADISNENGALQQFAKVLRRVSAAAEGNRLKVLNELSRARIASEKQVLLLENGLLVLNDSGKMRLVYLGDKSELMITKGDSPLSKRMEVANAASWDAAGPWHIEMDNDVDLTEFTDSIRTNYPNVWVSDTSRSSTAGWIICLGIPLLAMALLVAVPVVALILAIRHMIRSTQR